MILTILCNVMKHHTLIMKPRPDNDDLTQTLGQHEITALLQSCIR